MAFSATEMTEYISDEAGATPSGDPNSVESRSCFALSDEQKRANFDNELNNLKILWPGQSFKMFANDKFLKNLLVHQYPDWKEPKNKSSIPCVHIPKMFLHNVELSKALRQKYKSLQKGEKGESIVYRCLINEFKTDDAGIIVLPNVDGSHIFQKESIGCVEIDMIVAHPLKGIFIFNVKNASMQAENLSKNRKKAKKLDEKMKSEMLVHLNFLQCLMSYRGNSQKYPSTSEKEISAESTEVPIHAVFCYLAGNNETIAELAKDSQWYPQKNSQVIVFEKSDIKKGFAAKWAEFIDKIPTMTTTDNFDLLVFRLVALSSMEGSSAIVDNKIQSNEFQSIKVKKDIDKWIKQQLDETMTEKEAEKCKNDLIEFLKKASKRSGGGTRFVLWTKEQLNIIATIFNGITQSPNEKEPLRVNVHGAKGSGKTMLLIYLAELAQLFYKEEAANFDSPTERGEVLICDGSFGCSVMLFSQLRRTLEATGIKLELGLNPLQKIGQLKRGIVFIDEEQPSTLSWWKMLPDYLDEKVHCCIFSSLGVIRNTTATNPISNLFLSHTMRSTIKLQEFVNNLLRNWIFCYDMNGSPAHNLEGTNSPEITFVGDENMELFLEKCVETIIKHAESSMATKSSSRKEPLFHALVILDFLSPKGQLAILDRLKKKNVILRSTIFEGKTSFGKTSFDNRVPIIQLESFNSINGVEAVSVVVLLEKLVQLGVRDFKRVFLKSVTRATTHLAVVAINATSLMCPLEDHEILNSIQIL